ncbi:MAG: 1-acyl-sn-glycerol-3-phosphate acyltransferase [Ilumatobacter sp.]|nr:1-acyl-sn-glycerol-3-phosphate acyltransferase [Ilumatobacter sp.]
MSIPALVVIAVGSAVTAPVWLPLVVLADLVRGRFRFPMARLGAFGVCWAWIELAGVTRTFVAWITGRAGDEALHYELMRWWADLLMSALAATTGIRPRLEQPEALAGGNAIVLSRHASLADSLLSAWAIRGRADLLPRYVLKKELLADPCLDIVGQRIPNYFLDRQAADSSAELDALRALAAGVGPGVVGVIFAEGTRANDAKRARALEKIAEHDPARAERLAGLRRLLPPRPAGSRAMVEAAPEADVILVWHTGFDGLDSFGSITRRLARPLPPVRFVPRRVARADVPSGDEFDRWLDEQWLSLDREVDRALGEDETT